MGKIIIKYSILFSLTFCCLSLISSDAQAACWCDEKGNFVERPDQCGGGLFLCDDFPQYIESVDMTNNPVEPEAADPPLNCCSEAADPVYLHSGEFYYNEDLLNIPGRGMDLYLQLTYNSGMSFNGQFGYGWSLNYSSRLQILPDASAVLLDGGGRKDEFIWDGGANKFIAPTGRFEELINNGNDTYSLYKPDGTRYDYDDLGLLTAIVDRNGNTISLYYTPEAAQGGTPAYAYIIGTSPFTQNEGERINLALEYQLTKIVDTIGNEINFVYNSDGRLDTLTDNHGREIKFTYDPVTDDLLSIAKPATDQYPLEDRITKTFTYTNRNVTSIIDAKGQQFVSNEYNSKDQVIKQTSNGNYFEFFYESPLPELMEVFDRKGNRVVYRFNEIGNTVEKTEYTALGDFVTAYEYNPDGLRTKIIQPGGNGSVYKYDELNPYRQAQGNLLEIRRMADPDHEDAVNDLVSAFTYKDTAGTAAEHIKNLIDTATDANDNTTAYTYDYETAPGSGNYEEGNLVRIVYPEITIGTTGIPQTDFDYNEFGQVTKVTTAVSETDQVEVAYDYFPLSGYLKEIIQDPSGIGAATQFTYDNFGNPDLVTDANNHVIDYDFDQHGWLRAQTDPKGYVSTFYQDKNGNLVKIERQADVSATQWQTTRFAYDIRNNLTSITDPLDRITQFGYDANDNRTSVTDALNNITSYLYDERDLLTQVTDANTPAGVTAYLYDGNRNLLSITDSENNPTVYAYDDYDRLIKTTYADASFDQYAYDKNSNMTQHKTPSEAEDAFNMVFDYDSLNRLSAVHYLLSSDLDKAYLYDLASRLTDADTSASDINFTYDHLNRVIANSQTMNSNVYTLNYQYDNAGNMTKLTYPSGKVVDYQYDSRDQMKDVYLNTVHTAQYVYDPLNRRTKLVYKNNTEMQYFYDIANQLDQMNHVAPPPPAPSLGLLPDMYKGIRAWLSGFAATPVEALGEIAVPIGTFDYYNYIYDGAGNRTLLRSSTREEGYQYNDIYELTSVIGAQTHNYDYDLVGNREVADSVTYTPNNLNQYTSVGGVNFAYDGNGNLTDNGTNTYVYDDSNRLTSANNLAAEYEYDALNRRTEKTVGSATTNYVYSGDTVIAEYDDAGNLLREYVQGSRIDEPLMMVNGPFQYYYHHDGLGSVTSLTDANGQPVESYTYDAYGQPSITTSGIDNPYRFTGRRFDEETGIYHYRARQYDPTIGRFLQRDPIGYEDGMNLFAYTHNNPVNNIDPMGELTIPFTNKWIPAGEGYAEDALKFWTDRAARSNNIISGGFNNFMGGLAALWLPCSSDATATTLSFGAGAGRYLARPFYQYYPAGNSAYNSRYLTRGWGWKAPWKTGTQAAKKLSLPPYNPGSAVRRVNVNPFKYLRGPGRVSPEFGQTGGGIQYLLP